MQNTRMQNTHLLRQAMFTADTQEELERMMDQDVRPGEVVESRREVSRAEFRAVNRHERRKAAKLAKKKR